MRFHGYDLKPTSIAHSTSLPTPRNRKMSGPNINEETQRLIEPAEFHLPTTASLPKRRLSPHSFTATHSPPKGEGRLITTPPASTHQRAISQPAQNQQADSNAFEESFTAALSHPRTTTYDGQLDNAEYGDQTPLLNSCYTDGPANPKIRQTSRNAPLEPASKCKPSRSICLWHQISHNSQYTRPAAQMLREVLEERYPPVPLTAQQNVEAGAQVGGDRRRWWRRILRKHPTA